MSGPILNEGIINKSYIKFSKKDRREKDKVPDHVIQLLAEYVGELIDRKTFLKRQIHLFSYF